LDGCEWHQQSGRFHRTVHDCRGFARRPGSNGWHSGHLSGEYPGRWQRHGWFWGRVYAPSGTLFDHHNLTVVFAGYHTPKPKNGLGDYRTIGRVSLHSDREIVAIGQSAGDDDDE
jgi:hypothetical protein